jgi:hypothetical protein
MIQTGMKIAATFLVRCCEDLFVTVLGKVTLKSNGDEVLSDESP